MSLNGNDMTMIESGWYKSGKKVSEMKDDPYYKNFKITDVFLDPYK